MASLHEYFVKDGSDNITLSRIGQFEKEGQIILEVVERLHLDFNAGAKYISFYIPSSDEVSNPELILLQKVQSVLELPITNVGIRRTFGNQEKISAETLVFTGLIYFYSEKAISEKSKQKLIKEAESKNYTIIFRGDRYTAERNKYEKPLAFISHDSRDKVEIAEPLALLLLKQMCPVWYDDFSLKVGSSLRDSIEKGLKECKKCIFIITPNFLQNGGWAKREYDSIFTREIIEKQDVIIPVWHNVSKEEIYNYSPILADKVAANWSSGIEAVARKILATLN